MRNEIGPAQHKLSKEMAAFDCLPKSVRNTLNYLDNNFSAVQAQCELLNGWTERQQLIKRYKAADKTLTARARKDER